MVKIWQKMKPMDTKDFKWSWSWQDIMKKYPEFKSKAKAKKFLRDLEKKNQNKWSNDLYVCTVSKLGPNSKENLLDREITELSISRIDRSAHHDWRHMQYIKNDVLGEDIEGVELFPAQNRLVDQANQFWMYCLPKGERFPFGFVTGGKKRIETPEGAKQFGASQREFDNPEYYK
tara:strand:- start:36 stop:560 length:525 start_codon:yes stop_codon:yes gene_type:complete